MKKNDMLIKTLTHLEVSRKGGLRTLKKYGKKFYSENGRKGGAAILKSKGRGYYRKLGLASAKARKAARGSK